jgi:exodeoxyribonuclease VII large subunit
MPLLPKRIAVISVETSKGYSDFRQTLDGNGLGYRFFHMLFPAILQGERSPASIIRQLRQIRKVRSHFDVVAIIRGGGGEVGLTCYNDYALTREIALFPIPVVTGIGHSTNETVSEMVAFSNAITPTDLADHLLQRFHNYAVPVQKASEYLADRSLRIVRDEKTRLLHAGKYFRSATGHLLIRRQHEMDSCIRTLRQETTGQLRSKKQELEWSRQKIADRLAAFFQTGQRELVHMERTAALLDPRNVLKRGYSITQHDGKLVSRVEDLKEGDLLTTLLADGKITSVIKEIDKPDNV